MFDNPGKLRIALTAKPMLGKKVHADVLKGLAETASLLKELGHDVVEAAPQIDGEAFSLAFIIILAAEVRADIEAAARAAGRKVSVKDFDPATFGLGMLGEALSAKEYAAASRPGRLAIPVQCFGHILLHALASIVDEPEFILRLRVT